MDYKDSQAIRDIARTILNPVNNAPQIAKDSVSQTLELLDQYFPEQLDDTIPEILE